MGWLKRTYLDPNRLVELIIKRPVNKKLVAVQKSGQQLALIKNTQNESLEIPIL